MSLQPQVEDAPEERSAFFIGADSDNVLEGQDHHQFMLQKANALASKNDLKEAIDWFSGALQYGPVQPEQLSTFVDCILRDFKRKAAGPESLLGRGREAGDSCEDDDVFDCPNCHSFLGVPVTIACGHSYCKRCLQRRLLSKCRLCNEPVSGEERTNVILCGLLEKWFPEELNKSKKISEVDELCRRRCYQEAVSLATDVIQCDPETTALARLSRAEAYMALKQYHRALKDTELSPWFSCSAEALFRKAMVLHEMGQVDESLQVFLHCLAILCGLLYPTEENVKVGLRETTLNTSPHLRSKSLVADAQAGPHSPVQRQHQHQVRTASAHHHLDNQEKRWDSLERPGLSRAHSLRMHGSSCVEEGLKRVCSAPQLGDEDKASLLKRKLSVSDTEHCVVDNGGSKLKKQGVVKSSKQKAAKVKTCRRVAEDLLDANDLECSLCMSPTKNVPIFVCTMAYPTVPCPLHVFEPRYRLMIRRCMDTGTRQFGMCINDPQKGFVDFGCMLTIRSVHFLPDGRSVVDTIGGKRFRVLSRGMKDGYSTADIEHLGDARVEDGDELEKLQELHDAVYEQARVWFQNLKIHFHNQILQHFGPMPERNNTAVATPDGPACCWWLLAVLPIDPRYQLSVLAMTSLKERLVKIQHILTYLQSIPNN
ncbi:hypothetical protein FQN60_011948 [Etheostoma spectabile]|uniref:LON peptidase N-terminal domain and RING finger protein 1 n=1 Tax=Etheostoma spectabile TaxID=54343 RepID=A0A5J5DNL4_9PERO|nr:hypothetical protein FQN60_011948 [Etheostoma spectabile]